MGQVEETTFFVDSLAEKTKQYAAWLLDEWKIFDNRNLIGTVTSNVEELQHINNKENISCVISFVQQQLCIYE